MIIIRPITKAEMDRVKPIALAVASVICNTVALFGSIKATIKATRIIDKKRDEGTLDTKSVIKEVAPSYIIPAAAFVAGQTATIGSALLSKEQNVALTAAATAATYRFDKYRRGVINELGSEADKKVIESFKPDIIVANDVPFSYSYAQYGGPGEVAITNAPDEELILFDMYRMGEKRSDGSKDDGYFAITKSHFLQARHIFCHDYVEEGHVCLNQFYEYLGIPTTYGGSILGWDFSDGPSWVDIGLRELEYDANGNVLVYEIVYYWPAVDWPLYDYKD